ncbi:U6 snRNA-associated Sm-like protein, expressed [Canna indica]|uniref:U6 snRNA-associated Sm-like protein, expressed n=1 Tax=Canna indica TaxID=4628 RepID=A0AAQ3KU80_9LILI|nr:U6 snRNA-associated Sm-like protein, expressed [Canna indica]
MSGARGELECFGRRRASRSWSRSERQMLRSWNKQFMLREPFDLMRFNLEERIYVKCQPDLAEREIRGFLHAFDTHLNMILGDVEEIITTTEIDDETYEEIVRVCYPCSQQHPFLNDVNRRSIPLLFIRGEVVELVTLSLRSRP